MYVDASVIVAVLLEEAGFEQFGTPLTGPDRRFTSPLAIYEATVALVRVRGVAVDLARETVLEFLARARSASRLKKLRTRMAHWRHSTGSAKAGTRRR